MHLGLRLLFGFFAITGIAAYFVMRVFVAEVKPSVREVMEDLMVDAAHLLADQAAPDLATAPASLEGTRFAQAVRHYLARPVDAQIWGLHKRTLDLRVYVTDAAGRVVFDSGGAAAVGSDYSRWRDVSRTLRGEYGARATRAAAQDDRSSVMYVAAPVKAESGALLGVLTLAKPVVTVQPFVERAERKILVAGAWLLGLSLAVGMAVTWWTVHSVRRLKRYAQQAQAGVRPPLPRLAGELGELAGAMDAMRERIDGRAQVEQAMRALTHELKSPLTAIGASAELLGDPLPADDRERFAQQVGEQVQRLRALVDRLLALSRLEALAAPEHPAPVDLVALLQGLLRGLEPRLAAQGVALHWLAQDSTPVAGDAEGLAMALSNLLANALDFAPDGSVLELAVQRSGNGMAVTLRDHGPGVPDYALAQLGQRFYSTPRPRDGQRGSGLGLAIVRQVVALHGGSLAFEPTAPGLRVRLHLRFTPPTLPAR